MTIDLDDQTIALLRLMRLPNQTEAALVRVLVMHTARERYFDLLARHRERCLPHDARSHLNDLATALGRPTT